MENSALPALLPCADLRQEHSARNETTVTVSPGTITDLWQAITAPECQREPRLTPAALRRQGGVQIADITWDVRESITGRHTSGPTIRRETILDICRAFRIQVVDMFRRPKPGESAAWAIEKVQPVEYTGLLIQFERLGLPIDPLPMVEKVLPELRKQDEVTQAGLFCLWFIKEWRCLEPVELVVGDRLPDGIIGRSEHVTAIGYRAELITSAAGPFQLTVAPPKRPASRRAA